MGDFTGYIHEFDMASKVTDEELGHTMSLLKLYGPTLRRAGRGIAEMEEECIGRHQKTITEFIDLAIDFDHEADRRRIASRLAEMGHSMQLLELMDEALLLVKTEPGFGELYYRILVTRYYDAYCTSNEDAYLTLGISSATYYRHIKKAIRCLAGNLWHVVIPDLVISEKLKTDGAAEPIQSRVRAS